MKAQAAGFDPVELYEARQTIRPTQEKAAEQQLEELFQKKPSLILLLNTKQQTSHILNEYTAEYAVRSMIHEWERERRQEKPKQCAPKSNKRAR